MLAHISFDGAHSCKATSAAPPCARGAHSGGIGCRARRTEGYATDVREGGGGGSGPHAYKVRGRGGNSQPSGQVKGGHQLQVRGARTQTSCHASVRAPPLPSGTPRSLLRLLHPELPPRRETSAAGDRDQTGLEKMMDDR